MKTFIKIILFLVLLVALGLGTVFYLTSGLVESADAFFNAMKERKYDLAYSQVSGGFKTVTTQDQMIAFLQANGLGDVKSASWSNRSITAGEGKIEGTVTNQNGSTLPIAMSFVKEDGAWKISYINKAPAGVAAEKPVAADLPNENEAKALVKETIGIFAESLSRADFTAFHNHVSALWQQQATADGLKKSFQSFIDKEIDLTGLKEFEPVIDEPLAIDADGILKIKGHYPSEPLFVEFLVKYIREGNVWKVFGVNIDTEMKKTEIEEEVVEEEVESEEE